MQHLSFWAWVNLTQYGIFQFCPILKIIWFYAFLQLDKIPLCVDIKLKSLPMDTWLFTFIGYSEQNISESECTDIALTEYKGFFCDVCLGMIYQSYGSSFFFRFLRNPLIAFHSSFISLYSHRQCFRNSISQLLTRNCCHSIWSKMKSQSCLICIL